MGVCCICLQSVQRAMAPVSFWHSLAASGCRSVWGFGISAMFARHRLGAACMGSNACVQSATIARWGGGVGPEQVRRNTQHCSLCFVLGMVGAEEAFMFLLSVSRASQPLVMGAVL